MQQVIFEVRINLTSCYFFLLLPVMPLNQQDIIKVCEILAELEGLQVKENEPSGCYGFFGSLLRRLLGGLADFGTASLAVVVDQTPSLYRSQGKLKSAVHVIMYEMPETEKQRLANAVQNVVRNIDASDVDTLVRSLNSNRVLKDDVLQLIRSSLVNNMGLTLA